MTAGRKVHSTEECYAGYEHFTRLCILL